VEKKNAWDGIGLGMGLWEVAKQTDISKKGQAHR